MTLTDEEIENFHANHGRTPSSTPADDRPRCPVEGCGSIAVPKGSQDHPGFERSDPADYYCDSGHHFDEPDRGGADVE